MNAKAQERKAAEAAEREQFYKNLGKKPPAAPAASDSAPAPAAAPVPAAPAPVAPVAPAAPIAAPAAPAAPLAGRIFVRGAVKAVDRNRDTSKSVLLRIPEPMLKALDANTIGDRSSILLAMIGNAIERLERGEQIEFDAGCVNRWME